MITKILQISSASNLQNISLIARTFFLIAGQKIYLDFNFAGLSSFHHVRWDKLLGPPGPGLQSTLDKVTDTTKAVKIMQNTFIFVRLSLYKGVSVVETLTVKSRAVDCLG